MEYKMAGVPRRAPAFFDLKNAEFENYSCISRPCEI